MAAAFRVAHSTASVDEAAQSMSELYGPMTLAADPPHDFRYAAAAVGDDDLVLGRLLYTGSCRSGTEGFPQPNVAYAVRGPHRWAIGRDGGSGAIPFLIPPGRWLDVEFRDVDLLTVTVSLHTLTTTAAALLGTDHVRLDWDASRIAPVDAELVASTLRYLDGTVRAHPELHENPLIRAAVVRHTATILLSGFHLLPAALRDDREPSVPKALRRAMSFMDDNAQRPITVEDVARAARLSVRGLQAAFRRDLGTTPMAYLRVARLAGARRELVDADPGRGDTVEAIAHRWGFGHPARFAASYRAEYGEYPAATLRH
jgi:AraC-like DNA-binding protein